MLLTLILVAAAVALIAGSIRNPVAGLWLLAMPVLICCTVFAGSTKLAFMIGERSKIVDACWSWSAKQTRTAVKIIAGAVVGALAYVIARGAKGGANGVKNSRARRVEGKQAAMTK